MGAPALIVLDYIYRLQVEILVDDGSDSTVVEAGTLGDVTTSAALYDARLAADNGCDPAGCTANLTRVRTPTSSYWHTEDVVGNMDMRSGYLETVMAL